MRTGVFVFLSCTLIFALLFGFIPQTHALDITSNLVERDFDTLPNGGEENPPDNGAGGNDEELQPMYAGAAPGEDLFDGPAVAGVQVPPLLIGREGGETIMIASGKGGEVISIFKLTPGLDNPLQPAQQMESIVDLGIGVNARVFWDISSNTFSFSFIP